MLFKDVIGPTLALAEGCPQAVAVDALRNATIEFCTRTRWVTLGQQLTLTGAEVPEFDLTQQVVDIVDAEIDGEPVDIVHLNDGETVRNLGPGEYALRFADPNFAELTPAPTVAQPVVIDLLLAVAPGPEAADLSVDLWRRWSEALKHGALYRLYAMPSKPWSAPNAVAYHQTEFERAITRASAAAGVNRSQRGRRLRVKPA
jgi:hypothetical protein